MEVTIKGTPEEIKELLKIIKNNPEQLDAREIKMTLGEEKY